MPIANQTNNNSTKSKMLSIGKTLIGAVAKTSKSPIAQSVGELIEQADTPKASKANDMVQDSVDAGSKIMSIADKALKYALPIAKIALSLNDDEWFKEYQASGATFAETLQLNHNVGNVIGGVGNVGVDTYNPSLAEIATDFSPYGQGTFEFYNAFMPSVLSYVRKKTNNVLIEDTWKYTIAFVSTVRLYAIYYTMRKYEKLALHVPINMPTLPLGVPAIEAKVFNQMIGIADSLEGYLKSTCGLPHALSEYLRWRYGTIFYSENTGRPALITYDPFVHYVYDVHNSSVAGQAFEYKDCIPWVRSVEGYNTDFITALSRTIAKLQTTIQATGRAVSDLCLAYKDHQIKYDVNDATYDAKEFNLRCNLTSPSKIITHKDAATVILDSRLDQSAALQAVTCSSSYLPWDPSVGDQVGVGFYQGEITTTTVYPEGKDYGVVIPHMDNNSSNINQSIQPPFYVSDVIFVILDREGIIHEPVVTQNSRTSQKTKAGTYGTLNNFAWISALATRYYTVVDAEGVLVPVEESIHPLKQDSLTLRRYTVQDVPTVSYVSTLALVEYDQLAIDVVDGCLASIQMHNQTLDNNPIYDSDTLWVHDHTSLAYDTATINISQVKALHTMFIRNLTRGDYKAKSSDAINEAKDSVAQLAKDVLE